MDRRFFIFPAAAVTAWAQQQSPEAAAAEQALKARAEKFFQYAVSGNYRPAEALVAEDTKDAFYNGNRPKFRSFVFDKIIVSEDGTRATVSVKAKVNILAPGMTGQEFEVPYSSTWKIENGEWVWFVEQTDFVDTPFGKMKVKSDPGGSDVLGIMAKAKTAQNDEDPATQIAIDRRSVVLTQAAPDQTVTITNHLTGLAYIEIEPVALPGLTVEADAKELAAGKQAVIHFRAKPGTKPAGRVGINIGPINAHVDVTVSSN